MEEQTYQRTLRREEHILTYPHNNGITEIELDYPQTPLQALRNTQEQSVLEQETQQ